jgi:signal peptidase I
MIEKGPEPMATDITREFEYTERPRRSPTWQLAIDIGETIVLTIIMFLVIRLAVQDFQVDGSSMFPTLHNGQFVLVDKLDYAFGSPQRGDIVVFAYPLDHTQNYIKRIIGVPGDRIYVSPNGVVSVNGYQLTEPYLNNTDNPYGEENVILGANQYWMMGDNRGYSQDSRDFGPVKKTELIGKATLVYWPFNAFHVLPSAQAQFQRVPSPNAHSTIPQPPAAVHAAFGPASAALVVTLLPCAGGVVVARKRRWRE